MTKIYAKRDKMNYWIVIRRDFKGTSHSSYDEYKQNEAEEWSRYDTNKKGKEYLRLRHSVFKQIQKNDRILCYKCGSGFCALLRAGDKDNESIDLHFEKVINIPLETIREHFDEIKKCFDGENSIFTKSKKNPICNGTYFATNERQFEFICGLDVGENSKNIDDFSLVKNPKLITKTFTTRHDTGEKAEQFFSEHYAEIPLFTHKKLCDMRTKGLGYDFELIDENGKGYFVEIKGVKDGECDSVLFTQKEWQIASKKGEAYILIIINLTQSTMQLIQNPSRAKSDEIRMQIIAHKIDIQPLRESNNLYKITL